MVNYTIKTPPEDKYKTILEDSEGLSNIVIEPKTQRQVYMQEFGNLHYTCMLLAIEEALKAVDEYKLKGITLANFDISALTYQHFRLWLDNKQTIIKKQEG